MQDWLQQVEVSIEKLPKNVRKSHLDSLGKVLSLKCQNPLDLTKLLNDRDDEDLSEFSAWALGVIGDKRAVRALISSFRTRRTDLIWESALALAKIGGRNAERDLIAALSRRASFQHKRAAIAALGNLRSKAAIPGLLKILRNRSMSARLRGEAAEALGKVGTKNVIDPLLDATYDKSIEVRFWSVYALGQTGAKKAFARLDELANTDQEKLKHWGSISREAEHAKQQIGYKLPD